MTNSGEDRVLSESITRRLDAMIRILIEQWRQSGNLLRKDQLDLLQSVGLSSTDIGGILGLPPKDVSSALKKLQRGGKK